MWVAARVKMKIRAWALGRNLSHLQNAPVDMRTPRGYRAGMKSIYGRVGPGLAIAWALTGCMFGDEPMLTAQTGLRQTSATACRGSVPRFEDEGSSRTRAPD